ncbi:MAG: hypothetical protein ACRDG3_14070 [Tepidiformaceae bacterium]
MAQRRTITSGWFGNKVSFKLQNLSATLPGGLDVGAQGNNIHVASNDFDATGTVQATGPAAEVAKYDLGFLQTVFRSNRKFKYLPYGHQRTFAQRVAPAIFGKGRKTSDTTGLLPVRDGDTGIRPWYEVNDVSQFAAASPDVQNTTLYDQPSSGAPFEETVKGAQQGLVGTSGLDSFRTWLVIRKRAWAKARYRRLGYVDWKVSYKTTVTPNQAAPASSVIAPGANAGGRITNTVKGAGVYLPLTSDESANDAAHDKTSKY